MTKKPAILMLDDGTAFEGLSCGACQEASGEVVFTTPMAGYQETLTDPSYHGQLVTFTAAHLGNYGACGQDRQTTQPSASGAIFHELYSPDRPAFPHWRAEESLDAMLAASGITGISGVDTRSLTIHLREHGSRNGIISALDLDRESLLRRARQLPDMNGRDLASVVSCREAHAWENVPSNKIQVAVYDFGVKKSILDHLVRAGFAPTVLPAVTPAEDVLTGGYDAVFLSNGPGDPAACGYAVDAVRKLAGRLPLFGICLGHQILSLALGGKTYKLKFGHHGANHPVKDMDSGRVLITSQNHGFCVDPDSLPASARISHWNLNDDTLEGIVCDDLRAFSVQFHPEAAPGPNDAAPLFARFRTLAHAA